MNIKYTVYFSIATFLLFINTTSAQRIRKDHQEMTPSEKTAYVNALIVLRNNGTLASMASHHSSHFNTPIHSNATTSNGEFFFPWHRLYAFQMESQIRATSVVSANNLCVPYWDWRLENTAANVTWDDAGFLQLSAINTGSYTITRSLGTGGSIATAANVTSALAIPTFITSPPSPGQKSATANRFSYRMEYWHDRAHNFIGGTMTGGTSPRDPIFFLHHNFIDKLWQEWYDSDDGVNRTFYTFTTPSTTYWTWPGISPNVINDSRYMKYQTTTSSPVTDEEVWYAYNKKLVLDGINGTQFNITGINRLYCYTAWNGTSVNGEIFVGDVKRDASNNIIADNRGGLKIKSGATCTFSAGSAVTMLPGFESEYGAVFETKIVSLPCGFNSLKTEEIIADVKNEDLGGANQLYVYTQPHNNLTVNYTIHTDSKVGIQLFNVMGQIISSVSVGHQPAGYYQNTIDLSKLANGIYFCRLITDDSQQSVKFVY